MPSSRPVSARHAPGHDIPEKIVVRCVHGPTVSAPVARGCLRVCRALLLRRCQRRAKRTVPSTSLTSTGSAGCARCCCAICRGYLQPRTINEAKSRARTSFQEVPMPASPRVRPCLGLPRTISPSGGFAEAPPIMPGSWQHSSNNNILCVCPNNICPLDQVRVHPLLLRLLLLLSCGRT